MLKKLLFAAILVSGCTGNEDIIRYSDYNYDNLGKYNFNAKDVKIEHIYQSPFAYPNAEHLAPISPSKAINNWVSKNFTANGQSDDIVKVIITDASIIEKRAHPETKIKDIFVKKQNVNYNGKVELTIQVYDSEGITPKATMDINSSMGHTGNTDDSPAQKEALLYDLTKSLLEEVNSQVDSHIFNYLGNYLQ